MFIDVILLLLVYGAVCGAVGYYWGRSIFVAAIANGERWAHRAFQDAKVVIAAEEKKLHVGGFATMEAVAVALLLLVIGAHTWTAAYWALYLVGSASHAWSRAWVVVRSPDPRTVTSYPTYFKRYAPVLWIRFLWGTGLFVLGIFVGYGLDLLGVNLFGTPAGKSVASLFIGLAVDAVIDKFCAKYEWARDAVPAAPTGSTTFQDLSAAAKKDG